MVAVEQFNIEAVVTLGNRELPKPSEIFNGMILKLSEVMISQGLPFYKHS